MEYIVVGSREGANYRILREKLDSIKDIECIISGGARGVDRHAKAYARKNGIPYKEYPADWSKHGKKAGYLRNKHMADSHPSARVLIFWNGRSRGSQHWFSFKNKYEVISLNQLKKRSSGSMKGNVIVRNNRTYNGRKTDYMVKDVYIGRGSVFGNRHVLGPDCSRDESIARYRADVEKGKDPVFWKHIDALRTLYKVGYELNLVCFCAPLPCHGDVIRELVLCSGY